ncbi:Rhodanese-like domain-containing protein [Macrophomina phaseolina]|uniref:Rhodanese-like domain-containing protein n=1 Tax=Macrophomina phaseolina TaxID=35725 RepID=A0ABQ8G0Q8_9PEZI|nr:Rhodanese-like domain-containing protein [Macrophomina phaseolina]
MASRRAFMRISLRSATSVAARHTSPLQRAAIAQAPRVASLQPSIQKQRTQTRWHSAEHGSKSKVYDFSGIKEVVYSPRADRILIDVREPHEYAAGFIPTAFNMPIASAPEGLFLSPEEFEDKFGFQKPPVGNEVVFYCKAGVRSSSAAQLAQQAGYEKVGEYRGSWLDWVKNGGETSREAKGGAEGETPL